jgi:hypothetical protein
MSIVGIVKTTAVLFNAIASAAQSVEQTSKGLKKELEVVERASKELLAKKLNEYTGAVVKQFLGVSQPTIKSCCDRCGTIGQKLNGLEINVHKASKNINELLDEQEKLKAGFLKELNARAAEHPAPAAKADAKQVEKRLDAYLDKNFQAVVRSLEECSTLAGRYKEARKEFDDLEKRVKKLAAMKTVDEKVLRNVLKLVDFPLALLSGNGIATTAKDVATRLTRVAGFMLYDKVTEAALESSLFK